ncbi:MAG: uroporphyrinogen-III synthase, partial [Bacteroidales bacterium]|nr:uroporphyrinogen-III synthase [Bacteroidales bacterium]
DAEELKSYDMVCLFTPAGVQSLYDNCNGNYEQGDQYLALFGPNTQAAAEAHNLRIDIKAPTMETPSMQAALNVFLQNNQ